jgi:NAD-dependent DNA ligase
VLIHGVDPGSKLEKARALGVRTVGAAEFVATIDALKQTKGTDA